MSKKSHVTEIAELLNAPEGEHFEFKEAKNRFGLDEATKYLCAMSNCGGGKLVLGVSDKRPRRVVGSQAFLQPESTVRQLMDKLHIRVDFQLYEHEGRRVLVFETERRPVGLPIQVDGIAWWRNGDSLIPMPEDVRRKIYMEAEHDFSSEICTEATIDDLDEVAIEVFRNLWNSDSGNNRLKNIPTQQLLMDCGAVVNGEITYAALILFGKNEALRKYLPQAEIIFEYRSSNKAGPAQQREEFRMGFFASYNKIWELINLRNDLQNYQDGFQVLDIPTFNERVTREVLLNAASHRNYRLGGSIFVTQYSNRLVVESPGGLPSGITVDNILESRAPRNHLIADIFSLCGLVERAGQGMNLIYELCIREGKHLPNFNGTDTYFVRLTLKGTILNEKLILLLKKIGDDLVDNFITEDYLIIHTLFHEQRFSVRFRSRVKHLEDLGVVEHVGRGRYLLAKRLYELIGESNVHERLASHNRNTDKSQVLHHIEANNQTGSSLSNLMQLMPTQSRSQIQKILLELKKEGKIRTEGRANKARWYLV